MPPGADLRPAAAMGLLPTRFRALAHQPGITEPLIPLPRVDHDTLRAPRDSAGRELLVCRGADESRGRPPVLPLAAAGRGAGGGEPLLVPFRRGAGADEDLEFSACRAPPPRWAPVGVAFCVTLAAVAFFAVLLAAAAVDFAAYRRASVEASVRFDVVLPRLSFGLVRGRDYRARFEQAFAQELLRVTRAPGATVTITGIHRSPSDSGDGTEVSSLVSFPTRGELKGAANLQPAIFA